MSYYSTIHCYSQRLLNPFLGVTNFITYESAEAVTTDGVHLLAGSWLLLLRHLDSQTRRHYEQQA